MLRAGILSLQGVSNKLSFKESLKKHQLQTPRDIHSKLSSKGKNQTTRKEFHETSVFPGENYQSSAIYLGSGSGSGLPGVCPCRHFPSSQKELSIESVFVGAILIVFCDCVCDCTYMCVCVCVSDLFSSQFDCHPMSLRGGRLTSLDAS